MAAVDYYHYLSPDIPGFTHLVMDFIDGKVGVHDVDLYLLDDRDYAWLDLEATCEELDIDPYLAASDDYWARCAWEGMGATP